MRNFFRGAACVFEGIALFYKDKSLWKFTIAPWLVLLTVYTGVVWSIFYFSNILSLFLTSRMENYPAFLRTLLEGSLTLAATLLAGVIILTTLSTLFEIFGGLFFDRLIEAFEKKYFHTSLPEVPYMTQFRFTLEAAWYGIKSTVLFLILLVSGLFIPAAGQMLLIVVMGKRMGYALLFTPGFLRGRNIAETRQLFRKSSFETAGFGMTVYLLQLIPLLLPLTLPGMILGAVILYNRSASADLEAQLKNEGNSGKDR